MAIIPCNQLSLVDVFSDCQDIYEFDKPEFLSLLQSNIDLERSINHFKDCFGLAGRKTQNEKTLRFAITY